MENRKINKKRWIKYMWTVDNVPKKTVHNKFFAKYKNDNNFSMHV